MLEMWVLSNCRQKLGFCQMANRNEDWSNGRNESFVKWQVEIREMAGKSEGMGKQQVEMRV